MKTVTLEEAEANFDHYINEVVIGESFEITVNGESVARLLPFKEADVPAEIIQT